MRYQPHSIFALVILVGFIALCCGEAKAQKTSGESISVPGDENACEVNSLYLDKLVNMAYESGERVFVIARLGKGESSRYLIYRRLYNARTYLVGRLKPEQIVFAEGDQATDQGRVEFYLGSKLILQSLVARGGDICVDCCENDVEYYGGSKWNKKDSRRRQRQLEYRTPQSVKTSKTSYQ